MTLEIDTFAFSDVIEPVVLDKPVEKQLSVPEVKKRLDVLKVKKTALTKKNEKFLNYLSRGFSTAEAHKMAGYKGGYKAAYSLRDSLRGELEKILELQGMDKSGVLIRLQQLLSLPTEEKTVSVNQKIRLLQLLTNIVKEDAPKGAPKVTPFVIGHVESMQVSSPAFNDEAGKGKGQGEG